MEAQREASEREQPELNMAEAPPLPSGPAAAAILSAALFVFVLGFLTLLAAAAEGAKEWLTFQDRVGSLSGKSTMAGVVWILSWPLLFFAWRKREVPLTPILVLAAALIVVGALLMFPPIFERVHP